MEVWYDYAANEVKTSNPKELVAYLLRVLSVPIGMCILCCSHLQHCWLVI